MAFELNPQQRHAVKETVKWFRKKNKQVFEISGPPGSGKTTIVSELVKEVGLQPHQVLFTAFIGKAAQNLALKGNNAKTIHSAIYTVEDAPILDEKGNYVMKGDKIVTRRTFALRESVGKDIVLMVVDEGGTVDQTLGAHLLSFGLPVLVLGDIDQLPPVFGTCPFLKQPDIILTEIMRQAEDSEIIWMSQMAKQGKKIPYGRYNNSLVIRPEEVTDEMLKKVDMVITGRNKTRDHVNAYFREKFLKVDKDSPIVIGDKLVCRKNNWREKLTVNNMELYLINGMVGYVEDINMSSLSKSVMEIDFRPDFLDIDMYSNLAVNLDYLMTPASQEYKSFNPYDYSNRFQYGNCISVHLAQGSQYPSVLYYKESFSQSDYQRRLDYVALSRAESFHILVQ